MKKNAVVIALLAGVVIGVLGAAILPSLARPYLPRSLRGDDLPGVVRAKQRDGDRLLLTVVTDAGTILATFTDEVAGIDLLVQIGDSVALEIPEYEPFLTNPEIGRVSKGPEIPDATPPAPAGPRRDSVMSDSQPPDTTDARGATDSSGAAGRDTVPADTAG